MGLDYLLGTDIPLDCVPTHPHDEGVIAGIWDFIGTEVGVNDGWMASQNFFEERVGVNMGRGDSIKVGSLEYLTRQFMRNAPL
jgi:hypothetical protein